VLSSPAAAAATITLVIAMYMIITGIFRIIGAAATHYPNWGWMVLHGAVALLLGFAVWHQWPGSGLWFIGLLIGIEMIFNGWTLVMLGMVARKLPPGQVEA
ncbi:MAG TPA: DUF308 domain-containing protein, partial [Gammaproteobacteria bacterium]|nr:DUF308 domain-containing protein [Gammaproteobacteria bacterium]